MKKIMFNERYGLESAVLNGRKTMTRRIIKGNYKDVKAYHANGGWHFIAETEDTDSVVLKPHFEIGQTVAIAQSYENCWDYYQKQWEMKNDKADWHTPDAILGDAVQETKGWNNKMFVKAEHMPHQILITDIKIERLQDISNDDAMLEGVFKYDKPPLHHELDMYAPWPPHVKPYKYKLDNLKYFCEARWAFKHLINKVSDGYTWIRNPWVWVYTFKLVK